MHFSLDNIHAVRWGIAQVKVLVIFGTNNMYFPLQESAWLLPCVLWLSCVILFQLVSKTVKIKQINAAEFSFSTSQDLCCYFNTEGTFIVWSWNPVMCELSRDNLELPYRTFHLWPPQYKQEKTEKVKYLYAPSTFVFTPLVEKLHGYHYIMSHPLSSSTQMISSLLDYCSNLLARCKAKPS